MELQKYGGGTKHLCFWLTKAVDLNHDTVHALLKSCSALWGGRARFIMKTSKNFNTVISRKDAMIKMYKDMFSHTCMMMKGDAEKKTATCQDSYHCCHFHFLHPSSDFLRIKHFTEKDT